VPDLLKSGYSSVEAERPSKPDDFQGFVVKALEWKKADSAKVRSGPETYYPEQSILDKYRTRFPGFSGIKYPL